MAVNGYIKGLQYYFVSTPYDKRKVAGIFCEKYGATIEEWEEVLTIGNLYIECNLVQDESEATLGSIKYKTTQYYDYAAVMVRYQYVNSNTGDVYWSTMSHRDTTIFADRWAPSTCRNNAPIYQYILGDYNNPVYKDVWNIDILPITKQGYSPSTGAPIKSFPGWGAYPDDKEYNNLDEQVDVALEQQGKGLIASFILFVKNELKSLQKAISTLYSELGNVFLQHSERKQSLGSDAIKVSSNGIIELGFDEEYPAGNVWTKLNKDGIRLYAQYGDISRPTNYEVTDLIVDNTRCVLLIDPDKYNSAFDHEATQYGVVISGKKATDLLTAQGGVLDSTTLAKKTDYASTTEYGVVKMAGKVDALADGATTAEVADRLNTLIAYLKSAGLMSEN